MDEIRDPKRLHRRLEELAGEAGAAHDHDGSAAILRGFAGRFLEQLGGPLGVRAVVVYEQRILRFDREGRVDFANQHISHAGYELFTPFLMMAFFKGVLASIAGPAPNYDMQRILATRTSREAALMSGLVSPVLYVPRYFLVAGITVLALVLDLFE